jgi:sialic acid synthase SpsE
MIKVGSGNLTDRPLHELLASTDKKIVISTGMATPEEIDETLKLYTATNSLERLTLLLCTSAYPTPPEDVHLRSMRYYEERFGLPVGLSDHTRGNVVAFAAAALGAVIIEKHFTTDRNLPGPDQQTSATPEEFADLVQGLRVVEKALGLERKPITDTEREIATVARKSIVAASNLSKGTILTSKDLCFKRPGTGASPMVYPTFLGKKLAIAIAADEMILPEHVEEP